MIKVETFSNKLEIFHTIKELADLDDQVNQFIADKGFKRKGTLADPAP